MRWCERGCALRRSGQVRARRQCPRPGREPRELTERGPVCPQLPSRLVFVTGPVTDGLQRSEDCQVLSVTAPSDADGLPVMVWFHGGAYVSGSGESPKYDPDALVAEGRVVVVTVSYRLGIFGYCTPLGVDDDNLGLRDQLLALRWVHDNVAASVATRSASRCSVSPRAATRCTRCCCRRPPTVLYSRAIIQSSPLGMRDGRDAMTAAMRAAAADSLGGADPFAASVEELHRAQTASLVAAQRFGLISGLAFAPMLGVDPLPVASEVNARIAHVARTVDLFVGCTKLDAAPFVEISPRASRLRALGPFAKVGARVASEAMTRTSVQRTRGTACRSVAEQRGSRFGVPARLVAAGRAVGRLPLHGSAAASRHAGCVGGRPDAGPASRSGGSATCPEDAPAVEPLRLRRCPRAWVPRGCGWIRRALDVSGRAARARRSCGADVVRAHHVWRPGRPQRFPRRPCASRRPR